ncbi:hypothetical protein PRIEUP_LOCUS1881, partial [Pristimantis euphronides]
MKITDFFSSSKSSSQKVRPISTSDINKTLIPCAMYAHVLNTSVLIKTKQKKSRSLSGNNGSTTVQTPRQKRERFTDPEIHKLIDTVLAHIEQLFGPKALNAFGKETIWDKVVKVVNKAGGMKRTVVECKKKWNDYKRKVKQTIDKAKTQCFMEGQMVRLSDILTMRQIKVAEFFKMNTSVGERHELQDESSTDTGEGVEHVLTSSYDIDSEDEFNTSKNKSTKTSLCLPSTSQQDRCISRSYEEPQTASDPYDTIVVDMPIPPQATTERQLQLKTQMDQLVAQLNSISEMLQSVQKDVNESLTIQKNMYSLLKRSFLELQKMLTSNKKASSDRSNILELSLNNLHAKLDEMNSALGVKQLQEIMSSEVAGLSARCTQEIRSNPTATSTPAKKRPSDQFPSSTNLLKKTK